MVKIMFRKRKSDSTSSSDSENERIQEALDHSMFLQNDANGNTATCTFTKSSISTPVLDPGNSGLLLSEGFKDHIAKLLYEKLDREIKEYKREVNVPIEVPDVGIRLFKNSTSLLQSIDNADIQREERTEKGRKKIRIDKRYTNSEEEREKLVKESAVSADWIYSKKAIEGWATPLKGKVISLKQIRHNY